MVSVQRKSSTYADRMGDSLYSFVIRSCLTVVGALVAFTLIAAHPARAEVLVSNMQQSADGQDANLSGIEHFQGVVTGSNEMGYQLSNIEIHFKTFHTWPDETFELRKSLQ